MVLKKSLYAVVLGLSLVGASPVIHAGDMGDSFDAAIAGDYNSAMSIWQALAAQGNGQAQFNLGLAYHGGVGVERDETIALTWYRKAAESGYDKAQAYLAVAYEEGWFGLPQDHEKANYWRQKAGLEM